MSILGIDLGTAYARAAVTTDKGPLLLQFSDGSHALPAVVAYQKGTTVVGRAALAKAGDAPGDDGARSEAPARQGPVDPLIASIARYASFGSRRARAAR